MVNFQVTNNHVSKCVHKQTPSTQTGRIDRPHDKLTNCWEFIDIHSGTTRLHYEHQFYDI